MKGIASRGKGIIHRLADRRNLADQGAAIFATARLFAQMPAPDSGAALSVIKAQHVARDTMQRHILRCCHAVSYTHLTLPTILLV